MLDHQGFLSPTLDAIAQEKAGVLRPGTRGVLSQAPAASYIAPRSGTARRSGDRSRRTAPFGVEFRGLAEVGAAPPPAVGLRPRDSAGGATRRGTWRPRSSLTERFADVGLPPLSTSMAIASRSPPAGGPAGLEPIAHRQPDHRAAGRTCTTRTAAPASSPFSPARQAVHAALRRPRRQGRRRDAAGAPRAGSTE